MNPHNGSNWKKKNMTQYLPLKIVNKSENIITQPNNRNLRMRKYNWDPIFIIFPTVYQYQLILTNKKYKLTKS